MTMDVDPSATPGGDAALPAAPLSLPIWSAVRAAQAQHGVRLSEYARYRCDGCRDGGGGERGGRGARAAIAGVGDSRRGAGRRESAGAPRGGVVW